MPVAPNKNGGQPISQPSSDVNRPPQNAVLAVFRRGSAGVPWGFRGGFVGVPWGFRRPFAPVPWGFRALSPSPFKGARVWDGGFTPALKSRGGKWKKHAAVYSPMKSAIRAANSSAVFGVRCNPSNVCVYPNSSCAAYQSDQPLCSRLPIS